MKPSEVYEKVFTDYSAVQLTSDQHFCMFCKKKLFMIGAHLGIKMDFPLDIMSVVTFFVERRGYLYL